MMLSACSSPIPELTSVHEYSVITIPLAGPLANRNAEISGLAWYGDRLIILPQYPSFFTRSGDSTVFALPKADIVAFLDGTITGPLKPVPIPFIAPGLAAEIDGFEGYEAIAFRGDQAFLTIEAATKESMKGYLVSGSIAPDLSGLTLDTAIVVQIESQSAVGNKSDEALLIAGDTLVTIHEANGVGINASPVAHLFDVLLTPAGTIPFPSIEYRITDATALDNNHRFWAINYFFPGEGELLPETDPLADHYGEGPTHIQYEHVERLVEFQYSDLGIRLIDSPPIQLELLPDEPRNWEGLVRLDDRGFLLTTDKFPKTILGFVALPNDR